MEEMQTAIKPTYVPYPDEPPKGGKIVLRKEQGDAVKKTSDYFAGLSEKDMHGPDPKKRQFLWNAKMRFGKTLCALELVKTMSIRRTLIITHRPAVKDQWHEDFEKIFKGSGVNAKFGYRLDTETADDRDSKKEKGILEFDGLEKFASESDANHIVFFVSMQYLRQSSLVGGEDRSRRKAAILNAKWDLVIIDEAHEGTQTDRGHNVIDYLNKPGTLMLHLSGTPFNIAKDFESKQVFSWDYPQEQAAKENWDKIHPGESNPYITLPRMNIMRYNLGAIVEQYAEQDGEFKFTEFFRVEEGSDNPRAGRFVHEDDVKKFLKKLRTKEDNNFPFSNDEFRHWFRHTLWIVPGVKAAKALEALLNEDKVFKKQFKVINVAGKKDEDETTDDALMRVKKMIDPKHTSQPAEKSITISCGRLTTGVTVPQWSAVLYMKGSDLTSSATYMQTIFRVQSPHVFTELKNGIPVRMMKSQCYAFDFAPTRALNMVAETAMFATEISKRDKKAAAGKSRKDVEKAQSLEHMKEFLKYCDVMSFEGVKLSPVDADQLFEHLNGAYIDRIVRNGFDDNRLFNFDEIDKMPMEERRMLGEDADWLGGVTSGKVDKADGRTPLSLTQLSDVQKEALSSAEAKVPLHPEYKDWWKSLTKLEKTMAALYHKDSGHSMHPKYEGKPSKSSGDSEDESEEAKEAKKLKAEQDKERKSIVSTLKAVAVRIPLLIYGADLHGKYSEVTIDNITEIVDNESWREFMPKNGSNEIDKAWFRKYKKYFNAEFFRIAGIRYRRLAEEADEMHTEDRIARITEIFKSFKNPDKETVLTPWRVVNMHMAETIGGYCFYDKEFQDLNKVESEEEIGGVKTKMVSVTPRLIPESEVSRACFGNINEISGESNARILEINSKTGLYPLYVAYSIFRPLMDSRWKSLCDNKDNTSVKEEQAIWDQVLRQNVFVVCKTDMARSITQRTLRGFRKDKDGNDVQVNAVYPTWTVTEKRGKKKDKIEVKEKKDLVGILRHDPKIFVADVTSPVWWTKADKKNHLNLLPEIMNTKKLKFDAVVGNPPYQMTTAKKDTDNGQKRVANIFQLFQIASDNIGRYTSLIYPGGRWIHQSGKGVERFGKEQINSPKLKFLEFIENASYVFENIDVADGITLVLKDQEKTNKGFMYVFNNDGYKTSLEVECPGDDMMPLNPLNTQIVDSIKEKVEANSLSYLHDSVLSQKLFGIESDFVEKNPTLVRPYTDADLFFDVEKEIKLFVNDKAGSAGRAKWYIAPKDVIISGTEYIDKWKVIVSSAHPAGAEKRNNQLEILDTHSAFGRSRVALKTFDTEKEARNFFKYCQTDLIRFAMLMTDEALTSFAKMVPDLGDYSDRNAFIDFSKDVNEEVFRFFGITDHEIKGYIHQFVAENSK